MTLACQQLAADNALTAEYRIAEADELMNIHDEILQQIGRQSKPYCVAYDTSRFRYQDILNAFARQPISNVHIGFYHPKDNRVITMTEIIGG